MGERKYTATEVIKAIEGSDGIKRVIADRLGCHRHTVTNYIRDYATVRDAYNAECEQMDDIAESVVAVNIKLAHLKQKSTREPVETADAKWWLERRKRDKFATRQEVTGRDGEPMKQDVTLNVSDLSDEQLNKLVEAAGKLHGAKT